MSEDNDRQMVEDVAAQLGEHFEAVQILVCVTSPNGTGGTRCIKSGVGNWYARTGMAREFLDEDEARTVSRENTYQQAPPEADDDDFSGEVTE